jgi:hypothetical protein
MYHTSGAYTTRFYGGLYRQVLFSSRNISISDDSVRELDDGIINGVLSVLGHVPAWRPLLDHCVFFLMLHGLDYSLLECSATIISLRMTTKVKIYILIV